MTLFNYEKRVEQLSDLEQQMNEPTFWDDQERAQKVIGELKVTKAMVEPIRESLAALEDVQVLHELAESESDADAREEVQQKLGDLGKQVDNLETRALLSGKNDHRNCYFSIYAGDGGTELPRCSGIQAGDKLHGNRARGIDPIGIAIHRDSTGGGFAV